MIRKDNYVRKFIISLILMVGIIILGSTLLLTYALISKCEENMLNNTSALIAANASQLELNINSYLNGIEGNVALLFADNDAMNYDSSTTDLDEYDKISIESSISNRISDLGALENYGDFCVVYANDNTVGWKSKTTQNMYSDGGIYEDMCSYITNEKTQDGWAFGVKDNYDKMYYVKRYNPNAVVIASFYTRELENTFRYPDELKGMIVRLIDNNGLIVYSSDSEEIGSALTDEDRTFFDMNTGIGAITETDIVDTGYCENGWMVMCKISRKEIMGEFESLRVYAIAFCVIILFIVFLILAFGGRYLVKPMDGYVGDLSEKAHIDMLSGVYNRRAYEEQVNTLICEGNFPESAFIMFDVDNFKKVNDTLGHDVGDDIIARMGSMLTKTLVEQSGVNALVGRIGGDEFSAYLCFDNSGNQDLISQILDRVLAEFMSTFAKERKLLPISLSAGVFISEDSKKNYLDMYSKADSALYEAKESGKNKYCMYKGDQSNE